MTPVLSHSSKKKVPREFILGRTAHLIHVNSDTESRKMQLLALKNDKLVNHPFRHLIFGPTVEEKTLVKHLKVT